MKVVIELQCKWPFELVASPELILVLKRRTGKALEELNIEVEDIRVRRGDGK